MTIAKNDMSPLVLGAPNKLERNLAYAAVIVYALLSLTWAFAADAPWDDDCPTRFFNTQNALRDPANFISIWNRPLFVLLFALPSQLGKASIPIFMTAISMLGAWLGWKGLQQAKIPNAWLLIPFLAFQPFFFGTSRVALTEPLAATLILSGFYCLQRKQWLAFAAVGGLLPLARLELTVLLIFWLWPLVQAKQWKAIPLLVMPFFLWNIAAGILTGDFNYVFDQTFGIDKGKNRYGNTDFAHYFKRLMWVTGPIMFTLAMQGLAARLRKRSWTTFTEGQLLLGLLLYVVFSWKMSMGNAAGFLRNLVPLSPFVAILAVDGFNFWYATLSESKPIDHSEHKRNRLFVWGISVMAVLLTFLFYSNRLHVHQVILPVKDYSRLLVVALLIALGLIVRYMGTPTEAGAPRQSAIVAIALAALGLGYCLYQEPPSISDNADRQAMGIVANYYASSELRNRPTYVNHNWFFWANDENAFDPNYRRVTMANLEAAPTGAIIIWDLHYATRLAGDVSPQYLVDRPEFVELLRIGFANRGEAVVMLEKAGPDPLNQELISADFAARNNKFLPAILARSFRLLATRQFEAAQGLFEYALGSVDNDPDLWFGHGYAMLNLGDFERAAQSLRNAVALSPRFPTAWYNLGRAYAGLNDGANALQAYAQSLEIDPEAMETWYARGALYAKMGNLPAAIADFSQALKFNPNDVVVLNNRATAYAMTQQFTLALEDIAHSEKLKPGDPETMFVHGRVLMLSGKKEEGCAWISQAVQAGLSKAAEFLEKDCGIATPVQAPVPVPVGNQK